MATSVVPALLRALDTALSDALPNVLVTLGAGATEEPGDFLMIGVDDPDSDGSSTSVQSKQEWAAANYTARDESGDVLCAVVAWNGNGDMLQAIDDAGTILATTEQTLRANPSLDLAELLWTELTVGDWSLAQGENGASALVIFRIGYRARI